MLDAADTPAGEESKKKPAKKAASKPAKATKDPKGPAIDFESVPAEPPVVTEASETKPVKKAAKGKAPKSAKPAAEPELLFSSDRDDAPEAPVKPAPRAEPAATPAPEKPAPFVPTISVVGESGPASKPADSGKRHEAVEFDPSAIFARFAPKAEEPKPEASPAPAAPEVTAEPVRATSSNEAPATPSEDTARAPGEPAPQNQGRHPNDRHQDRRQGDHRQQQQGRRDDNRQQQQGRHPNDRQDNRNGNGDRRHPNDRQQQQQQGGRHQGKPRQPQRQWGLADADTAEEHELSIGEAFNYNSLNDPAVLAEHLALLEAEGVGETFDFNGLYASTMNDIVAAAKQLGVKLHRTPPRRELVSLILEEAGRQSRPIRLTGTLEILEDGNALLVYGFDNYRVRELSAFLPKALVKKHGLLRGHEVEALALPAKAGETAPMVVKVLTVMGADPEEVMQRTPFTELTPYYPTRRLMLETENTVGWDNLSMRCVDLLCPIGLGQRGLIVAPPRTGKTVLMQAIANSITRNNPDVHLIVLLVDERPEEVTDFRRHTKVNEVVASTFDENAESHVHAAEMVIERARRMVEGGRHVVILLDSITRLARAYNTMVPSSGKILSGGVEAGALTRPKRFFGSARNIEGGGSLTILGTALVDTGSKMDEVIFEEFKGTGNMELDLDRDLANKRIFPALNFERSGTRKEELLYHPDEMAKVYALRRAMKGVPSVEAMEMLIQRIKKTKTNAEFLVSLSR